MYLHEHPTGLLYFLLPAFALVLPRPCAPSCVATTGVWTGFSTAAGRRATVHSSCSLCACCKDVGGHISAFCPVVLGDQFPKCFTVNAVEGIMAHVLAWMRAASAAIINAYICLVISLMARSRWLRDFKSTWNNMTDGDFDGSDSTSDGKVSVGERKLAALLYQKPRCNQAELIKTWVPSIARFDLVLGSLFVCQTPVPRRFASHYPPVPEA